MLFKNEIPNILKGICNYGHDYYTLANQSTKVKIGLLVLIDNMIGI